MLGPAGLGRGWLCLSIATPLVLAACGSEHRAGALGSGSTLGDASTDAAVEAGPPPDPAAACSDNGWCWSNPLPQGNSLTAVWGSGPNDVWGVGPGTIVHWNGTAWSTSVVESGNYYYDNDFRSVWGSGPNDVWAFPCGGPLRHWDGKAWSRVSYFSTLLTNSLCFSSAWGSGPNDVWAVVPGAPSYIVHWNGTSWAFSNTNAAYNLRGIGGSGPNDVYAVGGPSYGYYPYPPYSSPPPIVIHWDGTAWSAPATFAFGGALSSVWASAPNYVWAVGNTPEMSTYGFTQGLAILWDGTQWGSLDEPPLGELLQTPLTSVWGSSQNDVWMLGGFNVPPPAAGSSSLYHWDGNQWTQTLAAQQSALAVPLDAVWNTGPTNVVAVGQNGAIVHGAATPTGSTLTEMKVDATNGASLSGVWSSSRTDAWAVGSRGTIVHFDGSAWSAATSGTAADLHAVWGGASNDVWVGGDGVLLHWDGNVWSTAVRSGFNVRAMWGNASNDLWAVGTNVGWIVYWDGSQWTPFQVGMASGELNALWGSGKNDVWAVGNGGTMVHWDGTAWTAWNSGTTSDLLGIFGVSANDVWAVGSRGGAHWNGSVWGPVAGAAGYAVWASATNDVVVPTGSGMQRWNGGVWGPVNIGANSPLSAVWGTAFDDVWAVGPFGTILHRQ
jgi:hypothetical protein